MPTSNPDPLCYPSKTHTHTPLPQCTVEPSCCRRPSNPTSVPPFSPPDKQRTLIIPVPIINPCCFHTMGPKEPLGQQRKHLLLSRQGTNSRILEAVSYIASVKNMDGMYADIQTITSSRASFFWPSFARVPARRRTTKFPRQRRVRMQIILGFRDFKVPCHFGNMPFKQQLAILSNYVQSNQNNTTKTKNKNKLNLDLTNSII